MWSSPPIDPLISQNEVHIWCASLDIPNNTREQLALLLSSDELSKAQRFHFQQHQQRYIAGRGILRDILAGYLKIPPQQIVFEYTSRGKPLINNCSISFNLSHSEGLALYAITFHHPVGIDLEYLRSIDDPLKIAQRFFTIQEHQQLKNLPVLEQLKGFFLIWTAKEAYLKATGLGLAGGLDQLELELIHLKHLQLKPSLPEWSLFSFSPAPDFIATVATVNQCNYQFFKY